MRWKLMYEKLKQVEELKLKLDRLRPFTEDELRRLNEEFMIEYT